MKINVFLKLTLFAFLCSILCMVAFIITSIEIIALITNWFWLISYFGLIAWLCSKIYKRVRYSVNLIFVIASFGIALYTSFWLGIREQFSTINDFENMSFTAMAFVLFTLICLVSAIVLVGRLIFGKPTPKTINEKVINEAHIVSENHTDGWVCECGANNYAKFCAECGKAKPESAIVAQSSNYNDSIEDKTE